MSLAELLKLGNKKEPEIAAVVVPTPVGPVQSAATGPAPSFNQDDLKLVQELTEMQSEASQEEAKRRQEEDQNIQKLAIDEAAQAAAALAKRRRETQNPFSTGGQEFKKGTWVCDTTFGLNKPLGARSVITPSDVDRSPPPGREVNDFPTLAGCGTWRGVAGSCSAVGSAGKGGGGSRGDAWGGEAGPGWCGGDGGGWYPGGGYRSGSSFAGGKGSQGSGASCGPYGAYAQAASYGCTGWEKGYSGAKTGYGDYGAVRGGSYRDEYSSAWEPDGGWGYGGAAGRAEEARWAEGAAKGWGGGTWGASCGKHGAAPGKGPSSAYGNAAWGGAGPSCGKGTSSGFYGGASGYDSHWR